MPSTLDLKSTYEEQGYAVARQLFTPDEVALLREHYMQLRAQGPHRGDLVGVDTTSEDPLKFSRRIRQETGSTPQEIRRRFWQQSREGR